MRTRLVILSAAVFAVASANATTVELFSESFPNYKRGWAATTRLVDQAATETAVPNTESNGWTAVGTVFEVGYSIRLGNSSYDGVLYSPAISLYEHGVSGTATLSFHAARTASIGTGNTITVTVVDSSLDPVSGVDSFSPGALVDVNAMGDANLANCQTNLAGTVIQHTFTGLPSTFRLKFAPTGSKGNARVAVGNVVMFQALPVLSTPANLDLDGVAGANDFSVEWDAVADANGYSVKLLDANDAVVSSNDVQTTSASFSGLTSSSEYTVVVVALGNQTTTDNSAAATLTVETAASAVAAPTLVVTETSWIAGVAGTSAVSATLPGDVACTVESVEMSDGSTATVANGTLSWTPPASTTASTVTATFHVSHGTDGWDIEQVLSVAATPAPSEPSISFSNTSFRSFDASWSSSSGGPVAEYKVRAWTGRATPDDATGGANENFATYLADKTVPDGWVFTTSKNPYQQDDNPVDFRNNNEWVATPDFGGTITSVSFRLRRQSESGSTFKVYGSTGSADPDVWKTEENTLATLNPLATQVYTISVDSSKGISRVFFQYTKATGNVSIGSFSVSGVNWPAADFLEGWGGAKVSVGTDTSRTFSNPVPGTANYVEVTAIGPTGLTATTIQSVSVPRVPGTTISVW